MTLSPAKCNDQIVRNGIATFLDVGEALARIHHDNQYRELGFRSFHSYCQDAAGLGRRWGYRLMAAAKSVANWQQLSDAALANEHQARIRNRALALAVSGHIDDGVVDLLGDEPSVAAGAGVVVDALPTEALQPLVADREIGDTRGLSSESVEMQVQRATRYVRGALRRMTHLITARLEQQIRSLRAVPTDRLIAKAFADDAATAANQWLAQSPGRNPAGLRRDRERNPGHKSSMQEAQHAPQTAPVLTVGDLQRVLQIGRRKGYDLVEDGGIPHSRGGNRIRFTPEQVNEYLSSRTIPMRVTTQTSDGGDTPSRG